jgi:hypothetical protein
MPTFLNRAQCYRLLQRELPEGVYPDGAASAYFSTADMDAVAAVAATGYANMQEIYENQWPQTAETRLPDWEFMVFGFNLPAALSLQERRDRVLQKIRSRKGISLPDMIAYVKQVIGSDRLVDISEWGCSSGGWMIGVSQLGIETYLNGWPSRLIATGSDICEKTAADYGVTEEQWLQMKEEAYTYQVNIYGYTLTDAERASIDQVLTTGEPARSGHVIVDGLNPENMLDGPYAGPILMALEQGGDALLEDGAFLLIG